VNGMERISLGYQAAVERYHTQWWEGKSALEIAITQLQVRELIVPFPVFHGALEEALGRPIWTHQFTEAAMACWFHELTKGGQST